MFMFCICLEIYLYSELIHYGFQSLNRRQWYKIQFVLLTTGGMLLFHLLFYAVDL